MNENPYKAPNATQRETATETKRMSAGKRMVGHFVCISVLGTVAIVLALILAPADPFSVVLGSVLLFPALIIAYTIGYLFARLGG
jgi:hypothetical protein